MYYIFDYLLKRTLTDEIISIPSDDFLGDINEIIDIDGCCFTIVDYVVESYKEYSYC